MSGKPKGIGTCLYINFQYILIGNKNRGPPCLSFYLGQLCVLCGGSGENLQGQDVSVVRPLPKNKLKIINRITFLLRVAMAHALMARAAFITCNFISARYLQLKLIIIRVLALPFPYFHLRCPRANRARNERIQ